MERESKSQRENQCLASQKQLNANLFTTYHNIYKIVMALLAVFYYIYSEIITSLSGLNETRKNG